METPSPDTRNIYLALIMTSQEIEVNKIKDVLPTRRSTRGRKPNIKTAEARNKTHSLFIPATRTPTQEQRRKMISLALMHGIRAVMTHHLYTFKGETYLQTEGGPIGLELTGSLARVFMLWWDKQFLSAVETATSEIGYELFMYKRYVDDCNMAGKSIPLGARLKDNKVVIDEDCVEADRALSADKRTAELIQQIANNICEFIQV